MTKLPELKIVQHGWAWRISPDVEDRHCLWLEKDQAEEIFRRCKAYEGLCKALGKIKENEREMKLNMMEIAGSEELKKRWQNMKTNNERVVEQALAEVKDA